MDLHIVRKDISRHSPTEQMTFFLANEGLFKFALAQKAQIRQFNQTMCDDVNTHFLSVSAWAIAYCNCNAKLSRLTGACVTEKLRLLCPLSKSSSRDNICKMIWKGLLSKHWEVLNVVTSWCINSSYIMKRRWDQRTKESVNARQKVWRQ